MDTAQNTIGVRGITPQSVRDWVLALKRKRWKCFEPKVDTLHQIDPALVPWAELSLDVDPSKCGELWLPNTDSSLHVEDFWSGKICAVEAEISGTIAEIMEWAAQKYGDRLLGPGIQRVIYDICGENPDMIMKLPNGLGLRMINNQIFSLGGAFRSVYGDVSVFCSSLDRGMLVTLKYPDGILQQGWYLIRYDWNSNYRFFIRTP